MELNYWKECQTNPPPHDGTYPVLVLVRDDGSYYWDRVDGLYNRYYNSWELWIDGFGWSSDSGYDPYYWLILPPYPPVPYFGEKCEFFCNDNCSAQKNCPRCYCQGNTQNCEIKGETDYDY